MGVYMSKKEGRISFRAEKEMNDKIEKIAFKFGVSKAEICRNILDECLKSQSFMDIIISKIDYNNGIELSNIELPNEDDK